MFVCVKLICMFMILGLVEETFTEQTSLVPAFTSALSFLKHVHERSLHGRSAVPLVVRAMLAHKLPLLCGEFLSLLS